MTGLSVAVDSLDTNCYRCRREGQRVPDLIPVEEVFKISGVPTYTYVTPSNDTKLKVALRTPGRGVVVEGPSGIGKSTAVNRALQELGITDNVTPLSARRPSDLELIRALPEMGDI